MKSRPNIGLSLLWIGIFLGILGVLFALDRLLLLFCNLFISSGFFFLLGSSKFVIFFLKRRKGTFLYLIGISLIVVPIYELNNKFGVYIQLIGIIVQILGFYFLFHEFLPNLISYLKLTPLNSVLKLRFVDRVLNFLSLKQLPT
ncbi:Got1/Sft2-like family protein [Theileria parva strain Muguga]|uniref:Got1/Sft2-like family protein n=1 Tax=Theileria parva strain Muguga TaxID=333668 RepID=UPI001C619F30|nr:Got1/Sft2-like family protein [Theileria parva strain Muguga]EAN31506.2 Got1/Sft2-like family protein [Theileria parva strain Muguga]